jgi:hypothetical protein
MEVEGIIVLSSNGNGKARQKLNGSIKIQNEKERSDQVWNQQIQSDGNTRSVSIAVMYWVTLSIMFWSF